METTGINNSFQKIDYSVRACKCELESCASGLTEVSIIFQWKESPHWSMGNPHTIIFTDDVNDIEKYGKKVSESNIFPEGCNVEFVEVINKNKIKMRVYERGSGETLSCGTGACASVVAGVLNGYLNDKEEVEANVLGGKLYITYNNNVYMEGDANIICIGNYLVKKR